MTILYGRCYPCEVGKHDSCRGPDCACELVDPGHHSCALKEVESLGTQIEAWQSVFGTSQLSHAQARLEAAEAQVESLRQQNKLLEDIIEEKLQKTTWYGVTCSLCGFEYKEFNQSIIPCPLCKVENLQTQLAAAQETICEMREALEKEDQNGKPKRKT